MKLISVDSIKEGMVLSEDIYNQDSIICLNIGTFLKPKHARLLKNLKIDFLYVEDQKNDHSLHLKSDRDTVRLSYNKAFKKTLEAFKNVYTNVTLGKQVIINEVAASLEPLVEGILNNNDILGNLRHIEIADEYTFKHSINVSLISSMIGKWLGFDERELKLISIAGLLHDLGKSKIPNEILNKPSKLTEAEFEIMKEHAFHSYSILKTIDNIEDDILLGVFQHHEKINGTGYPMGLLGKDIHKFAKVIAIADIFDAMTNNRCYRLKSSPFEVADELIRLSSFHLDAEIVSLFIKNISHFFVGNQVILSNGFKAEVIMVNPYNMTRPLVKTSHAFIDLSKDFNLKIIEVEK